MTELKETWAQFHNKETWAQFHRRVQPKDGDIFLDIIGQEWIWNDSFSNFVLCSNKNVTIQPGETNAQYWTCQLIEKRKLKK
jgi:hypothetical protein